MRPRENTWNKGAETYVGNTQERGLNMSDFVERFAVQAKNFSDQEPQLVKVFINAGHRDEILQANNQLSAAKAVVRNEPHLVPKTIDGLEQQAAFMIALAKETEKPEYNQ